MKLRAIQTATPIHLVLALVAALVVACTSNAGPAESEMVEPTVPVEVPAATVATDTPTSESTASETDAEQQSAQPTAAVAEEAPVQAKINLNGMTQDELTTTIPDFSTRMVREFFEYQPYISIQQFRREIGKYVDDNQVAFYEEYVYVPIDVDASDSATLMQIPGVDDAMAESLMAGRPYGSNEVFLESLAGLLSADQVVVARTYLRQSE